MLGVFSALKIGLRLEHRRTAVKVQQLRSLLNTDKTPSESTALKRPHPDRGSTVGESQSTAMSVAPSHSKRLGKRCSFFIFICIWPLEVKLLIVYNISFDLCFLNTSPAYYSSA